MTKEIPRIAFNGDLTVDRYIKEHAEHLGGSSLNGAIWAHREGAKTSILAAVGGDDAGASFRTICRKHDIDVTRMQVRRGSTSTIFIDTGASGERVFSGWDQGVLSAFRHTDTDIAFLNRHDAAVVTVYDRTVGLVDALRGKYARLPKGKPFLVADFGDLTMFDRQPSVVERYAGVFDMFVFGLDKDADESVINSLREYARQTGNIFLVTLGKPGGVLFRGSDVHSYIGVDVPVLDTTGAGDSFLAGYLVRYLKTGNIDDALARGAQLSSRVVQRVGAY